MMKRIGIEALLTWGFCEELPKAGAGHQMAGIGVGNAWRPMTEFGELLAVVDSFGWNRFGVWANSAAEGEPHPDAIAVHDAVKALNSMEIGMPDGWDPLADLQGIDDEKPALIARALAHISVIDKDGVRRMKGDVSALLIKHAVLGGCPPYEADQPERRYVSQNGKPQWFRMITIETSAGPMTSEVDGFDAKARRPMAGAYRKTFLDPDPTEAVCGRAEYQVWRFALDVLAEQLAGRLADHVVEPSSRSLWPWEEAPELAPRVLPDLSARSARRVVTRGRKQKRLAA